MLTRYKKTQSFSVAGASSDVVSKCILEAFKVTPGGTHGTLTLAHGPVLHLEVVSHSPVLTLKATSAPSDDVNELNISLCICDVCMGNVEKPNAAVASVEMVVRSPSAEAADALMTSVAEGVAKALPSKSTCFADTRAATPDSVINES
jgi:hypothetical protein